MHPISAETDIKGTRGKPMNDVQAKINRLLDSRFVTKLLALPGDEGRIAGYATGFYLEDADLEALRPLLDLSHYHANVGQIGCYRATPVCPKAKWKANGQPFAEYQGILLLIGSTTRFLPFHPFGSG